MTQTIHSIRHGIDCRCHLCDPRQLSPLRAARTFLLSLALAALLWAALVTTVLVLL